MAEKTNALQLAKKTQDGVMSQIKTFQERGELAFPSNYSPENALKSAWLMIQETQDRNKKPAIEVCTQTSLANALLSMVVQGLNPDKKQCYFIVYGNKLICQRSYFGAEAVAKRVNTNVVDFQAQVIYEKDDVQLEIKNGKDYVVQHIRPFGNIDKKEIIGAYCTVIQADEDNYSVIMTMDEIKDAWKKSQMNPIDEKGNVKPASTHGQFTAEMAKKTVTNRAAKHIINTSDDGNLITQIAKVNDIEAAEASAEYEIEAKANQGEVIDAEFMEVEELFGTVDEDTGEYTEPEELPTPPAPEQTTIADSPGF